MKTVFIFGAGASADAGAPVMADFLDKAKELTRPSNSLVADSLEAFNDVFNAIADLQSVYAKSHLDLDNIESLFGAIEMGRIIEKFSNRSTDDIEKLHNSIVTLIYKTIENSTQLSISDSIINPPATYQNFLLSLKHLTKLHKEKQIPFIYTLITFNYDLLLDFALHSFGTRFSYCLLEESTPPDLPLLKLHGSINWGYCTKCEKIIPYSLSDANFSSLNPLMESIALDLGSRLNQKKHHDLPLQGPPILVPPTWNKTQYHSQLANVWKRASKELAEAENIIIIGYSLPDTDLFFRYLFALGSQGRTRIRKIIVVNPDNQSEERFKELIGRGVQSRFIFMKKTFRESLADLASALENF